MTTVKKVARRMLSLLELEALKRDADAEVLLEALGLQQDGTKTKKVEKTKRGKDD